MKIIVGLGNPGTKYENTRHNVGFLAIDQIRKHWKEDRIFSKNQGEVFFVKPPHQQQVLLVKPKTYMNRSGHFVAPLFRLYQCAPEHLIVIHDDLDLPFLTMRMKTGGGTGGHRGLQSLAESLGKETKYHRIRIGIDRPCDDSPMEISDYVLQRFSDQELLQLNATLEEVVEATLLILDGNIQEAMNRYHKKPKR